MLKLAFLLPSWLRTLLKTTDMDKAQSTHTNSLIHESSPYLLQHAHNPVDWMSWTEAAWERARNENKLVLISIGYSACHWCHVMEHESFEDESVANIMNEHFVCIKVDREERPDVDQVYMIAVQLMTGHGGWPMNCFAMPDGRPVYGGTYFQKKQWMDILINLADIWKTEPGKVQQYADQLLEGVRKSELIALNPIKDELNIKTLQRCWKNWSTRVDVTEGGPNKAPKFPLPNNYLFLLHLSHSGVITSTEQYQLEDYLHLTLKKMAWGGLYDQVGGGFARYSTDTLWKAPHFEKMLYDNAQLVSLYSEAYRAKPDELYKQVVYETLDFVARELTAANGAFYSALDADSEGEEGRFYVWKKGELEELLGPEFPLFAKCFSIDENGLWEHGNYILLRRQEYDPIAKEFGITKSVLKEKMISAKNLLLLERSKRVRPGLDDKSLCSWNALMAKAYADAYRSFSEPAWLDAARKSMNLLLHDLRRPDGGLFHTFKNGKATVNGFLEDYSFTIEACLALYECSFEASWLSDAAALCEYALKHFQDNESGFFYFTSSLDPPLIARKFELSDNVIPASNSSLAKCLFQLGHFLGNEKYISLARHMLLNVQAEIEQYGAGYSNWAILHLWLSRPFFEVAIVGKDVDEKRKALYRHYHPNVIFAGSLTESTLPLLKDRYKEGSTLVYVCRNQSCLAPVSEIPDVLEILKKPYEA
jgi:uncharacterized protein YyaL (SSP411 family)